MRQLMQNRLQAAIELLEFKATSQMCEGKTTCTLDEIDVNEILIVAGAGEIDLTPNYPKAEKELEVIV